MVESVIQHISLENGAVLVGELTLSLPNSRDLVLLVHGTCSNRNALFLPYFCRESGLNSLRIDLAGNGDSAGEFLIGGFEEEVEQIKETVEWANGRGFRVVAIVGHSKGGNEVLIYGSKHRNVPLLIPVSARWEMGVLPKFLEPVLGEVMEKGFALLEMGGKRFRIDRKGIEERRNLDMRKVLEKVEAKVVVIHGERDDLTSIEDARTIAALLHEKCITLTVLPEAGHMFAGFYNELTQAIVSGIASFYSLNPVL
jgi:uncharacterized protein